tara:strand:- start:126 stop:428 length:303 start_codon:yes stop_codon:yes gene_type:complete
MTTENTEQKIPSPENIKKEPIKFSPEEITELNAFRKNFEGLIYNLGQVNLTKIQLKNQENQIHQAFEEARQTERQIAEKLSKKYGQGSLDIESGTFIPAQ